MMKTHEDCCLFKIVRIAADSMCFSSEQLLVLSLLRNQSYEQLVESQCKALQEVLLSCSDLDGAHLFRICVHVIC